MANALSANLPATLPIILASYSTTAQPLVITKVSTFVWNVGFAGVTITKISTFRWNVGYQTIWTKIN